MDKQGNPESSEPKNEDGQSFERHFSTNQSKPLDFRDSAQYHDVDSYVNQRSHSIGVGIFHSDEIQDLPPRYQKKVIRAYEKIVLLANQLIPQHLGDNFGVDDILSIGNFPRPSRGRTPSIRGGRSRDVSISSQISTQSQRSHGNNWDNQGSNRSNLFDPHKVLSGTPDDSHQRNHHSDNSRLKNQHNDNFQLKNQCVDDSRLRDHCADDSQQKHNFADDSLDCQSNRLTAKSPTHPNSDNSRHRASQFSRLSRNRNVSPSSQNPASLHERRDISVQDSTDLRLSHSVNKHQQSDDGSLTKPHTKSNDLIFLQNQSLDVPTYNFPNERLDLSPDHFAKCSDGSNIRGNRKSTPNKRSLDRRRGPCSEALDLSNKDSKSHEHESKHNLILREKDDIHSKGDMQSAKSPSHSRGDKNINRNTRNTHRDSELSSKLSQKPRPPPGFTPITTPDSNNRESTSKLQPVLKNDESHQRSDGNFRNDGGYSDFNKNKMSGKPDREFFKKIDSSPNGQFRKRNEESRRGAINTEKRTPTKSTNRRLNSSDTYKSQTENLGDRFNINDGSSSSFSENGSKSREVEKMTSELKELLSIDSTKNSTRNRVGGNDNGGYVGNIERNNSRTVPSQKCEMPQTPERKSQSREEQHLETSPLSKPNSTKNRHQRNKIFPKEKFSQQNFNCPDKTKPSSGHSLSDGRTETRHLPQKRDSFKRNFLNDSEFSSVDENCDTRSVKSLSSRPGGRHMSSQIDDSSAEIHNKNKSRQRRDTRRDLAIDDEVASVDDNCDIRSVSSSVSRSSVRHASSHTDDSSTKIRNDSKYRQKMDIRRNLPMDDEIASVDDNCGVRSVSSSVSMSSGRHGSSRIDDSSSNICCDNESMYYRDRKESSYEGRAQSQQQNAPDSRNFQQRYKDDTSADSSKSNSKSSLPSRSNMCHDNPRYNDVSDSSNKNRSKFREDNTGSGNISKIDEAWRHDSNSYENNRDKEKSNVHRNSKKGASGVDTGIYSQSRDHRTVTAVSAIRAVDPDIAETLMQNREDKNIPRNEIQKMRESGFFVHVGVSEQPTNMELWHNMFRDILKHTNFDTNYCCHFTESLILSFNRKEDAQDAVALLKKTQRREKMSQKPHVSQVENMKTHIVRPCDCEAKMYEGVRKFLMDLAWKYMREHSKKMEDIDDELDALKSNRKETEFYSEQRKNLLSTWHTYDDMLKSFEDFIDNLTKDFSNNPFSVKSAHMKQLKSDLLRECNSFSRCMPIYSRKRQITDLVRWYPVSVIIAETGSGKSTQIAAYVLQTNLATRGTIVCTQPRKIAAVTVAEYVSGQVGSALGTVVGYDLGNEKKFDINTKVIYMTDYALLKKFLRNRNLKGISCVIIDEAHERSLYTDLLLAMIKQCLVMRKDLSVVITSATIEPTVFQHYFDLKPGAILEVPGRTYPVDVIWYREDVAEGWDYVKACVKTAVTIHIEEPDGDILVFLTSPKEIDDAILLFKNIFGTSDGLQLLPLHGKCSLKEQRNVFRCLPELGRKIIFSTNSAETSLTIPGIRYVVDSGMTKEMIFYPEKNKSCLQVTFINKSSAEQRKGRAGRTQPGVCYRMYSRKNYKNMDDRPKPEIMKTNLQRALLKVMEFGYDCRTFDFVEVPHEESIKTSLRSLEHMNLIKDNKLTDTGRKVIQLPIDPQLAKLVLDGVSSGIGHEAAIMAALSNEAGRLFVRFEDNKELADKKKIQFCLGAGDFCSYLEVYKRWLEVPRDERFDWCVANYVNSKALNSAKTVVNDIFSSLHHDLSLNVSKKYNNAAFKNHYERIIFDCFSENLCLYSGHLRMGYLSPHHKESLFLHPSSVLSYLKVKPPEFVVYGTLMQTTREYIVDLTPISDVTIKRALQAKTYHLSLDSLRGLQMGIKTIGPFGESMLVQHILGKAGSKMDRLHSLIDKATNTRSYYVDVCVEKGLIMICIDKSHHARVLKPIMDVINVAHNEYNCEEDVIKMKGGFSYFCLGTGGVVKDIILPGEFRELIIQNVRYNKYKEVKTKLKEIGEIQWIKSLAMGKNMLQLFVTYVKAKDANTALLRLKEEMEKLRSDREKLELTVRSTTIYTPKNSEESVPLYQIDLVWLRRPSSGTGYLVFSSDADRIGASGYLTQAPLLVGGSSIIFTPSSISQKEIEMKNISKSENISEREILEKVHKVLPDFIRVKSITIRRKVFQNTETDISTIRQSIHSHLNKFTQSEKVLVNVTFPNQFDIFWNATAYFEKDEDGEKAFTTLKDNFKLKSIPVTMKPVIKFRLTYQKYVFDAVKSEILSLKSAMEKEDVRFSVKPKKSVDSKQSGDDSVVIDAECKTMRQLRMLRSRLMILLQGTSILCYGNKKYYCLFTKRGENLLKEIEEMTNTVIRQNNDRKVISIFGSKRNSNNAEHEIHMLTNRKILFNTKIFDLKNSQIPTGFLKCLYAKYGLGLEGLVSSYNLFDARVDTVRERLELEGSNVALKNVEEVLEKICEKLYQRDPMGDRGEANEREICAICLDPVPYDFQRLECCGHAFCKSCLLLQVESRSVPLICAKQGCEKMMYLIDIKRILPLCGNNDKENFYRASMQHFVSHSIGQVNYCPFPDCDMVYRVSSTGHPSYNPKFHCIGCDNYICTFCQEPYHEGYDDCDRYQKIKKDEDYSLRYYMHENQDICKECPNCKVVIEKWTGCNHMECGKCNAHFCWLCLQLFKSGKEVYEHLPLCPNNN